jgi:hypothetical protein
MIPRKVRQVAGPMFDHLEQRTLFAAMVGLTSADQLVTFDSATPATATAPVAVTGLATSETLLGIDFRPATGQLFGLGSTGRLYTLNLATGAATALGTTTFAITGTDFGFDFNPQVDRIRIVSDTDLDARANPNTGTLVDADTVTGGQQNDTNLAFATGDANVAANPNVAGVAYNNNFSSTGSTTLYAIDTTLDVLATQGSGPGATTAVSPNSGQLFTVGALGVDLNNVGGFDVAESDGVAYAAFGTAGGGGGGGGGGASTFYTINLTTGAATAAGAVGSNLTLKDLSAVPTTQTLFVLAASGTSFAALNLGALATNPTTNNITGLSGDTLVSLDFRPATGDLLGATADGQLYTINAATGAATALGTGFTPALTGNITDIDFNPTVDRIRVITDADTNARANPGTGALVDADATTDGQQNDTNLAFATTDTNVAANPDLVAAAYTNSVAGATATTLYALDAGTNALVTIGSAVGATTAVSPNTGQLFTVGALGVDVATGGLDIANGAAAYAVINAVGGTGSQLYTINTTSGVATLIGTIGDGTQTFADIAVGATVFTIAPATQTVDEDLTGGNVTLTVTRGGVADGAAVVSFVNAIQDQTNPSTFAQPGTDYGTAGQTSFSGTVTFADGETTKTITIPIIDDTTTNEPDETLTIGINSPTVGELGAAASASVTINDDDDVVAIGVADDPVRIGNTNDVLTINGTDADEEIVVTQSGANLVVTVNGTAVGNPTPRKGLYRIVVNAGGGDDIVRINSKVATPAEIHGEAGNDLLVGSRGKDLLIGGDGVDALYGRGGEDILIGGISDYTGNPLATATLLNAFLGKGNFATRAAGVSTGTGVGTFIFSNATIDDDTDRDYLAGEGTADLILSNAKDAVADESPKGIVTPLA